MSADLTGTRLDPILAAVRERAAERRRSATVDELRGSVRPVPERRGRFVAALRRGAEQGLALIAECKRRSPSAGLLADEPELGARALSYASGGADALSILTEQDHFGGSPADLEVAAAAGLPRLRKDFIVDEGMVLESVAMGADAILLIAACLPGALLADLRAVASEVGLAVLVEAHDEAELERALEARPDCIGVNARDLRTFQVDLDVPLRLLPRVPEDILRVTESGLATVEDVLRARDGGAHAALIGSSLMRADDPARLLREWKGALGGE